MGQRPPRLAPVFLLIAAGVIASVLPLAGCDHSPASSGPASPATSPATQRVLTVASLSPAATEILDGLGLGDRLVAVSNFDRPRARVRPGARPDTGAGGGAAATENLPRVGDYQTTDWERLATLRPSIMVTQFGPDRLPAGMVQKADALNIRLVNVSITRLADIYDAMRTLAAALERPELGERGAAALKAELDAVAARSTGRRVRALIVTDHNARGVAGRGNYLDDILQLAGGENVIAPGSAPYPALDREALLDLDPEVVFQLLPDASPQVRAAAGRVWASLPSLQAVRNGRVHVIDDPWSLNPTHHVAELAGQFSRALNAARGVRPATTTTATRTTTATAGPTRITSFTAPRAGNRS